MLEGDFLTGFIKSCSCSNHVGSPCISIDDFLESESEQWNGMIFSTGKDDIPPIKDLSDALV
jgi:hypothetical protein